MTLAKFNYSLILKFKCMKRLCVILLFAGVIVSCKKEINQITGKNEDQVNVQNQNESSLTKLDYFKMLTKQFLTTAQKSLNFKKWVYSSCFAQDSGDYYISIYDLLSRNEQENFKYWTEAEANYIKVDIINNIKSIDLENEDYYTAPIVFVPFIEDINIDSLLNNCPTGAPKAVISMQYDSASTHCLGYTLGSNEEDTLTVFANNIDENYAWSHDLWVFGQEEVNDNTVTAGRSTNSSHGSPDIERVNGRAEYGAIIQVTNINQLESWVAGKLEFRYYVFNAAGTKIKDKILPKLKRKDAKNMQWKDFNDFIANWNISNIGNFMIEGWIELDGGPSNSNINFPIPPACTGCPSISVSVSKQRDDQNMGQSIVQFTDPVQPTDPTATVYGISYANFRRKH